MRRSSAWGSGFIRVGAVGIKSEKIRQYFPGFGQEEKSEPHATHNPGNSYQPLPSTRMSLLIDLSQQSGGDLGIDLGGSYIHVTEQLLHYPNVRAAL